MTTLEGTASVAEVIDLALSRAVERLVEHEHGVREGDDPEDIHQARVATRRLRSDLSTFRAFIDEEWTTSLRAELRWLGAELGEVRDIEVLTARLRADVAQLPSEDHAAAERLVDRLAADWPRARAQMNAAMSTDRYATLRERLVEANGHARCTTWANLLAVDALPGIVRRRWRHLRKAVDDLGDNPTDEALHATRIRAKRARYATEATIPVFGTRARDLSRAIERVQTVLGEHQDAVVARSWIAKTASECSPTEAFAAGMLAEIEQRAAQNARGSFPDVWAQARKPALRNWL